MLSLDQSFSAAMAAVLGVALGCLATTSEAQVAQERPASTHNGAPLERTDRISHNPRSARVDTRERPTVVVSATDKSAVGSTPPPQTGTLTADCVAGAGVFVAVTTAGAAIGIGVDSFVNAWWFGRSRTLINGAPGPDGLSDDGISWSSYHSALETQLNCEAQTWTPGPNYVRNRFDYDCPAGAFLAAPPGDSNTPIIQCKPGTKGEWHRLIKSAGEAVTELSGVAGGGTQDPDWKVLPLSEEAATVSVEPSALFRDQSMTLLPEGDGMVRVTFDPDVVATVNGIELISIGFGAGWTLDDDATEFDAPSIYAVTVLDVRFQMLHSVLIPFGSLDEVEIKQSAIAAALSFVPGPKATPGWTLPAGSEFTPDDVEFSFLGFRASKKLTTSLNEAMLKSGHGVLVAYEYVGSDPPPNWPPVEVVPVEADAWTLFAAEGSGEFVKDAAVLESLSLSGPCELSAPGVFETVVSAFDESGELILGQRCELVVVEGEASLGAVADPETGLAVTSLSVMTVQDGSVATEVHALEPGLIRLRAEVQIGPDEWLFDEMVLIAPSGVEGDLDGDGLVGSGDLGILLSQWGSCPDGCAKCAGDLDGDAAVNGADLGYLLASWSAR